MLDTCGICDTDYKSDNWEPEFMTVFVTWQSRVTLDSIRNSCDVYELSELWGGLTSLNIMVFQSFDQMFSLSEWNYIHDVCLYMLADGLFDIKII